MSSSYSVYVLELRDGCYYIGKAVDVQKRTQQHVQGKGAEWTKLHKPIRIERQEDVGSNEKAKRRERELVNEYVAEYGKDKVRGAGHTGTGVGQ